MTLQKFCRRGRISLAVFAILLFISVVPAFSQKQREKRQIVNVHLPLQWTQDYALILLEEKDLYAVNEAKEYVEERGGSIAIFSNAKAMLGWVPRTMAPFLVGKHGITSIHYEQVDVVPIDAQDEISLSLVKFFNLVVTGEVERQNHSLRWQGDPLVNDVLEHPFVNPAEVAKNLEDKNIEWDAELARTAANGGIFPGYSDSMTGTVACNLFFVESDGTIDSNLYTWTTSARDQVINQCYSGASWWANQGISNDIGVSFYIYYSSPESSAMKQGYEPILHSSSEDSLWINAIMANLGYSSGTKVDRVTSFNSWLKSHAGTNWAYSCFFAYNPSGAPSTFTNGYFAYAYLGGPYSQMLYRNDGWSISDIWSTYAHETGHIFWACDEYYQAGYGGCTSCSPCNSYRPVANGNCEHPSCNPGGSVPCMMKASSDALCSYTVAQVGWQSSPQTQLLTIRPSSNGTTSPPPGTYKYDTGFRVHVTAIPNTNYEFLNWNGDITGTQNPVTITMNGNKTIKAIFFIKPKLTIQSNEFGTTNPSPGVYYYAKGTRVKVTAIPNTNYEFLNWSGDISSTQNPAPVTIDGNKTIKANFRIKPKLTIQSNEFGTTNPSPGVYYYATGTQVQIGSIPKTYCVFINWTGDATGTANPVSVTMNRDKSISANFRYIYAPTASGVKVLNRTFSQAEYINILSWEANPANAGLVINKYRIYLINNGTPSLLAEVGTDQSQYSHRNAGQGKLDYAIVEVHSSGREGAPAVVTVQ